MDGGGGGTKLKSETRTVSPSESGPMQLTRWKRNTTSRTGANELISDEAALEKRP